MMTSRCSDYVGSRQNLAKGRTLAYELPYSEELIGVDKIR